MRITALIGLLPLCLTLGCNREDAIEDTAPDTGAPSGEVPLAYDFESRFGEGSSVSYDGQIFRHLLIRDLTTHLGRLTSRIDTGFFPEPGDVAGELDFYFAFDSDTAGTLPHLVSTDPAPAQKTYDDVSSGKDLVGKIAGNDPKGQHVDWSKGLVGWEEAGALSPEDLVRHWIDRIDAAAVDRAQGVIPTGPDGKPLPAVFLDTEGRDLQQLLQKFLLGAVAFSQAADDYLDDDIEGHGLLSPHAAPADGKPYSALEHAWDEGFGYFGAARDYGAWDDATIASPGCADTWEPDGSIDLVSECSWGHSQNAAKRDRGAVVPTDLTWDAWEAFVRGRELLARTEGELSAAQLDELRTWRDRALLAWERAIAATVVHYVNDVLQDMSAFGTDGYSYADHAKHWSELKGFALSFQFNPHSPLSGADFAELHTSLGTRPALPTDDDAAISAYRSELLAARELVGKAFGFDPANLGDENGQGGW